MYSAPPYDTNIVPYEWPTRALGKWQRRVVSPFGGMARHYRQAPNTRRTTCSHYQREYKKAIESDGIGLSVFQVTCNSLKSTGSLSSHIYSSQATSRNTKNLGLSCVSQKRRDQRNRRTTTRQGCLTKTIRSWRGLWPT
jgi:hypothetical protein